MNLIVKSQITPLQAGGVDVTVEDMTLFLRKQENRELYESYTLNKQSERIQRSFAKSFSFKTNKSADKSAVKSVEPVVIQEA
jgi:hypothetical protein